MLASLMIYWISVAENWNMIIGKNIFTCCELTGSWGYFTDVMIHQVQIVVFGVWTEQYYTKNRYSSYAKHDLAPYQLTFDQMYVTRQWIISNVTTSMYVVTSRFGDMKLNRKHLYSYLAAPVI